MLDSFYRTHSDGTELLAYVAEDDPKLSDYKSIRPQNGTIIQFAQRKSIVRVFNDSWCDSYDYYVDCNDDFIFKTKGWDDLLRKELEAHGGIGMAHGVTKRLPSAAMIARRNIETLGWWMYPACEHQYIDSINHALYKNANQLYLVPSVEVEHVHPCFMPGETGREIWDETYAHVYSPEIKERDELACRNWVLTRSERDVGLLEELKKSCK